ncbi:hypothetical protein G9464_17255 [Halostella sp. JP-L12]|uniref:hypothetical protein n=1 Tax=Halostella TaxID=1843185 RepID=UPI000EF83FAB|nr:MULTISPECIES: hypothetical protein [Halostella]NHN49322.1 hypothetical protein [Halostella sp. JP-L12]
MSTHTSAASTSGTVHLNARVPTDLPDTEQKSLYKHQERVYLVELHKFGDVDDTGRVWNHHYVAVYATITGQRAIRFRVDADETLRATRPIHERGGSIVPWGARLRSQRRILDLHLEDGDTR